MRPLRPGILAAVLTVAPCSITPATADYFRLEGHGGPIKDAAATPDGSVLTASFDTSVGVWDLRTGRHLSWLDGHLAAVNAVAPAGPGRALSGGDDFAVIYWDTTSGEPLHRFEGHRSKVIALDYSPETQLAASASWDGTVGLWNLETSETVGFLSAGSPVNDIAFLNGGQELLSAGHDGTIRRWDVAGGKLIRVERRHGFGINRLLVDDTEGWMILGANDGSVYGVDLETGEAFTDLTLDESPILALAEAPEGKRVAIGDAAGYVRVVSSRTWTTERNFRAVHRGPIWALAFDGEGQRLASASLGDHVDVWPMDGGEIPRVLEAAAANDATLEALPNGEQVFLRRCAICHALGPEGGRRAGPTLYGVFGRRVGGLDGYAYSEALTTRNFIWTERTIDELFDLGPDKYVPGTKMPVQRIAEARDRRDLIFFLRRATVPDREEAD